MRRTHRLMAGGGLCLNYVVVGARNTSNRVSNTLDAANSALHPTLRVVGYAPNVAYMDNTVLLVSSRGRCNRSNMIMVNSITMAPGPATSRLTRVTCAATRATRSITNVTSPRVTVLDFSAVNDTGSTVGGRANGDICVVSGMGSTMTVTGRGFPRLRLSNRLRTSTTLIPRMTTGGTPGSRMTNGTGMLMIPGLRINGVNCGLIRHLNNTVTVNPVLRNVTHPIGSLSHNYSMSSVCCVMTVATYRTRSTGGTWSAGFVCGVAGWAL